MKLTATKVKTITKTGLHADGGGLYLRVAKGGSKSWVLRIMREGRRRDIGLGSVKTVSLTDARAKAVTQRAAIEEGRDPVLERKRATAPTFAKAAREYRDANLATWKNERDAEGWLSSLENHVFGRIGNATLDLIEGPDVIDAVTPVWLSNPATGKRVLQRVRKVFGWALARGYCRHNPAGDGIEAGLPVQRRKGAHHPALPYAELPAFMETLDASKVSASTRLALRFLILTAARSGEARGALWSEIDLAAREWRIPAHRMKAGVEHVVPLSGAALAVLEEAKALRQPGCDLVFPASPRRCLEISRMTFPMLIREWGMRDRASAHGMRSSFRDWCGETGVDRDVAEACLAHVRGGVEGAYYRSSILERRRPVMEAWGAHVAGDEGGAKVLRLHG